MTTKIYRDLAEALTGCIEQAHETGATPREVFAAMCATMSFAVSLLKPEDDDNAADFLEKAVPKIMQWAAATRKAGEPLQ
jgi:hypothetical protein